MKESVAMVEDRPGGRRDATSLINVSDPTHCLSFRREALQPLQFFLRRRLRVLRGSQELVDACVEEEFCEDLLLVVHVGARPREATWQLL